MLKILRTVPFFAPAYGYGGPVVHTLNVSKIQASMGYDIRIFTTNILKNDMISKKLPKYEIIDGIKIHRFPIKYRLGKSHYFITPQLMKGFLKFNYDIIHAHSYRTFQTDIATLFSYLKRKPFVFTSHGTLRQMYLLNLFLGKKKESSRMKFYDSIFKNFFIKAVDQIIVHSKHEKYWTLKFDVPKEKISIIPHGVNLIDFTNNFYKNKFIKKYKPKGKMILYVGRLLRNYRKIELLITLMKDILKEIEAKLWIVGESYDDQYELELRNLVNKLGLNNNIIFINHPSREDIIGAYQSADVFVFPITESDSFGIPLIEAGAAKCPVISTRRGPAKEIIKDGKNGLLIDKDDDYQLKDAILNILSNETLRKKLGSNAFENVKKNYSWELITEKTNKVYEKLL